MIYMYYNMLCYIYISFSLGFQCLFSSEIEIEPFKKLVNFYIETDF